MSYPKCEVRKVQNGYILSSMSKEWIYDNYIELIVCLAEFYDEREIANSILEYCKNKSEEVEQEVLNTV